MSALPPGWIELNLGDVADKLVDGSHNPPPKVGVGLPMLSARNILDGKIDFENYRFIDPALFAIEHRRSRITPGDVLLTIVGTIGRSVVVPSGLQDFTVQRSVAVMTPGPALDSSYLSYFLRSVGTQQWLENNAKGTAQKGIYLRALAKMVVPLAPLAEQRRIVAKVDGSIARTARARKDLDRIPRFVAHYKERLLSLALTGELTSAWRKSRNLASGKEVQLGEVAERFDYGSSAKSSKKGSIPVLRMGNIQDGKLDWSDLVYTSKADEIDKYRLQRGDVLFNRTNSPTLVGKTALFDSDRETIHAGYLIRVRCGPSLLPSFLTYSLNSPMGRAYSWKVKTDGVSQSNINAKKLAAFSFWLPSLDEQAEIVRHIETAFAWLDRVAAEHAAATKLLAKLDAAIFAKAFRGELVPQDPSDEPASALLARIRAEPRAKAKARSVRSKGTVLESRGRLRDEFIRAPKRTRGREVSKSRQDDDVRGKPYLAGKLKKMSSRSVQDLFRVADLGVADFYKQLAWEIAEGHIIDNAEALEAA